MADFEPRQCKDKPKPRGISRRRIRANQACNGVLDQGEEAANVPELKKPRKSPNRQAPSVAESN